MSDPEPPIVQPWLRIDCEQRWGFLWPGEGAAVRDFLRTKNEPAAERLATLIDSAVTMLLAAPAHAGTRSVRIEPEERGFLLEAAEALQQSPVDRYAKLRLELTPPPSPA
jgi:hypothetical protein